MPTRSPLHPPPNTHAEDVLALLANPGACYTLVGYMILSWFT